MDLALFPECFRSDLAAFPEPLLRLLADELRTGNVLTEVGAGFPAPPAGCCAKLAKDLTTHPSSDSGDLRYREWPNWTYTSGFTDEHGRFFVLNPPPPPPPEPDMDAIRAAQNAPHLIPVSSQPEPAQPLPVSPSEDLVQRFRSSMVIDYERWHDGIGYDLESLRHSTGDDRRAIESLILQRGAADWRDVEALAALDTPQAREVLRSVLDTNGHETRVASLRCAPQLFTDPERTRILVEALREATFGTGLSQALDQAAESHAPAVIDTLLWASVERAGDVAVHCAALVEYLLGRTSERFDMSRRAFYLRFNTPDHSARENAFRELCNGLGLDPRPYLN